MPDPTLSELAQMLTALGNKLQHPNVHRPWTQWSEDETLHIIGVYDNPFRWRTRREHAANAIRHLRNTPNVALHVVELAHGTRPFELTGEHPNDVQVRTDSEMWHKENLINVAATRLPADYKYAGYCDMDFHFTRHDWALEAIHLLQHHDFVQLFSSYSDLTPQVPHSNTGHRPYRLNSSFGWNYTHQAEFKARKLAQCKKDPYYGLPVPQGALFPFGMAPGSPGGAWAWKRSAFDTVGGLLDTCVLGSGDWHMAFGLIEGTSARLETEFTGRAYNASIRSWQARAALLSRNIGCVDNFAVHYFHGTHGRRAYGDRWRILVNHDFDPVRDLARDWQGVWRWAGNKPRLRDDVRKYFLERDEDGGEATAMM
jgi:hypothetical protein